MSQFVSAWSTSNEVHVANRWCNVTWSLVKQGHCVPAEVEVMRDTLNLLPCEHSTERAIAEDPCLLQPEIFSAERIPERNWSGRIAPHHHLKWDCWLLSIGLGWNPWCLFDFSMHECGPGEIWVNHLEHSIASVDIEHRNSDFVSWSPKTKGKAN